jgi:hypothetical protein
MAFLVNVAPFWAVVTVAILAVLSAAPAVVVGTKLCVPQAPHATSGGPISKSIKLQKGWKDEIPAGGRFRLHTLHTVTLMEKDVPDARQDGV